MNAHTVSVDQLRRYYAQKQAHYPIVDDFMQAQGGKYMQTSGGYIKIAAAQGIARSPQTAEPNQKWHLLESYLPVVEASGSVEVGPRIVCPELLLWMAEAAGIDEEQVRACAQEARRIIDTGAPRARNTAGIAIRKAFWPEIVRRVSGE